MAAQYNNPPSTASSIGSQVNVAYYQKKALVELPKLQYFSQLADVTSMPKNYGKKIKRFHYMPMLDDRNLNDQGLDAAGAVILNTTYHVSLPSIVVAVANASKAAAATALAANSNGVTAVAGADGSGGTGLANITLSNTFLVFTTQAAANAVAALNVGAVVQQAGGNLYGSSKDVGLINSKMPALTETGGRVNRVGFKRKELEGTLEKFGFFDEYTQESLDFDNDEQLLEHINREMILGANEMTEDALQIDLLSSAGVVKYGGSATSKATIDATSTLSYVDFVRTSVTLDQNRCPKQTKFIDGSRMIDTKVLPSGRVAYMGSELIRTIKEMKDLHNNPAFIGVERYAAGTTTMNGEIGSIDQFRIVIVPEMMRFSGAGATATDATFQSTNGKYDVFPVLVVGDESFTTIGFQTDGKSVKFKITHKPPGEANATYLDPYGELGFMSIKWYYGFMCLRPERIALMLTVAKL